MHTFYSVAEIKRFCIISSNSYLHKYLTELAISGAKYSFFSGNYQICNNNGSRLIFHTIKCRHFLKFDCQVKYPVKIYCLGFST